MVKGTSRMRASVCANSVLPEPVGPISRMLDFASSTSLCSEDLPPSLSNWRAGANAKKVQGDHARQVVGRGFAPRAEQAGYQLELAPPRERPTAPAGSRCLR